MILRSFLKVSFASVLLVACSSDDDTTTTPTEGGQEETSTYVFVNDEGESTVDFGGQTTRLAQGAEILSGLSTFGTTEEMLDNQFGVGTGFEDASLDGTKYIRNKTAASLDYFSENSIEASDIKEEFDAYISSQVDTFLSVYTDKESVGEASEGVAGVLGSRLVNANGLELNQAFNKGLIGAWNLDQIANHYMSRLDEGTNTEDNDNGVLVEGETYTAMEHFWDEAYGYLYGASTNTEDPNSIHLDADGVVDSFLYKYVQRVNNDDDFAGIADDIFDAYVEGRAAIVNKDYTTRDEQADVIRKLLSDVIAIRAVYYLQQGKEKLSDVANINDGSAFHDLSEGYGFVYSLRFTRNVATGESYFTEAEVDGFIADLDAGNGFWDLADDTSKLDEISQTISDKFDFTLAQAAE